MAGPYNAISAQQLPESELIKQPIRDIGTAFATLGGSCQQLATQLDGFAADVEKTQNAIRELLHKLGSLGGIAGMFFEFFKGHGEDELHKIADDIKTVMNHLKSEASSKRAGVQQAEQNVDTWVRDLEKSANREFTEFFGDHVGQVLSGVFNSTVDSVEGGFRWVVSNAEGIEDMNPLRFAYDPDGALQTWKGIADLSNAVTNPASLAEMARSNPQQFEAMLKGLARTDEWSKDRPMLGASQNMLDILTLPFAAGKAAEASEVAGAAGRVAKSGDLAADAGGVTGKLAEAGEAGRATGVLGNISKETPQIAMGFDDITAKPPTVDPPAGGRPVPAPHAPDASPPPVVKPVPEASAAPRTHSTEAPAVGPAEPTHSPAVVPEGRPIPAPSTGGEDLSYASSPSGPREIGDLGAARSTDISPTTPKPPIPSDLFHSTPAPAEHVQALNHPAGVADGSVPIDHGSGQSSVDSQHTAQHDGVIRDASDGPESKSHEDPPSDPAGHQPDPLDAEVPGPTYELPDPARVTPPPDSAFFWSGRNAEGMGVGPKSAGGGGFADAYANDYHGTTLEGLLERNGVVPPKWSWDDPAADRWWSDVSDMYAESVHGEVRAVIGSNLRPGNIWETVELPRLMDNPNVTRIVVIDPDTGHETVIFTRGKDQ
ncbi:hypothetical protein ACQ86B_28025 [Mycolicibacterium aichiense]|uniref:hypothetical protein n=1 Tax=Mycolicibacterium aichiense TaxID=1799 RepID=UPI003D668193